MEHHIAHFLKIPSADRGAGQTIQSFRFNIDDITDVHSFRIEEIIIPNTFYPINSYNNTFVFNPSASGNKTATITPGNYDSTSFTTELKTRMDAVSGGPTYTVTVSAITAKITIAQNAGTFTVVRGSSTIAPIMGLNTTLGTSTAATSFTGDNIINLGGSNVIVMRSERLLGHSTKIFDMNGGAGNGILCRIPVNLPFGSVLVFKPYNKYYTLNGERTSTIDISLYDQWGNPLDLNGQDYFMSLKLHTGRLHNLDLRKQIDERSDPEFYMAQTFSTKN